MANRAVINIFTSKTKADVTLKELSDAGFDAAIVGPLDRVKLFDHYCTDPAKDESFTTPAGAQYYLVTGWNKTAA